MLAIKKLDLEEGTVRFWKIYEIPEYQQMLDRHERWLAKEFPHFTDQERLTLLMAYQVGLQSVAKDPRLGPVEMV